MTNQKKSQNIKNIRNLKMSSALRVIRVAAPVAGRLAASRYPVRTYNPGIVAYFFVC